MPKTSLENRMKAYCQAFGWQGGTIHQIAEETGVDTHTLLYGVPENTNLTTSYTGGWFAGRTCSIKFNKEVNFPANRGNKEFWLGLADGIADNFPKY